MRSAVTVDAPGWRPGRVLALAAASAALVTGAWCVWPRGDPAAVRSAPTSGGAAARPAPATPSRPGAFDPTALAAATIADPARLFDLGVAGDLRLDLDTTAALELIVAELGDDPLSETLARLDTSLRAGLPRDAAQQVLTLVHAYRAFSREQAARAARQAPPQDPQALRAWLDGDAALRRRHFDPATAQALFGVQEAYARHALDAQRIDGDPALSAVEKARRQHALRLALPAELVALEPELSPATSEMALKIAELRERGAPESEVQAMRVRYLGSEAAERLGEVEAQTARRAGGGEGLGPQRDALLATAPADTHTAVDRLQAGQVSSEALAGARAHAAPPRH